MNNRWNVLLGLLVSSGFALAPLTAGAEWLRYTDPRFGTSVLYPDDLFTEHTPTPTGATFAGAGGYLEVSAANRGIHSVGELRSLIAETAGYDEVTYSPGGRNWLVVSGYRGSEIFYEKYFVKDGIVEGFALEYPAAARVVFDPVVERIEDSFIRGR